MYRRDSSNALYRSVARMVWERYRPRALELPVGLALLRDAEVPLADKVASGGIGLAAIVLVFAVQTVLARTIGLQPPAIATPLQFLEAVAGLAVVTPLVLIRIADPEHVVRVRLRRLAVIPIKRREP